MLLQDTAGGKPAEPAPALSLAHLAIAGTASNVQDASVTSVFPIVRSLASSGSLIPQRSGQVSPGAGYAAGAWLFRPWRRVADPRTVG